MKVFERRIAPLLAFFIMFFSQTVHAFFDPPTITPPAPVAGQTVSVNIHGGTCDAIEVEPGYPQITQSGNAIRLRDYGEHFESGDDLCIFGIGTVTRQVGLFAPGPYSLTVELAYIDGFGTPSIFPIGVVPFAVAAPLQPAVAASVDQPFALLALVASLILAARAKEIWLTEKRCQKKGANGVRFIFRESK